MDLTMNIEELIQSFREDLPNREIGELVQRHIIFGNCYALIHDEYFELKNQVSRKFGVNPTEVVVVGSAKLGFSVAPEKRYRSFGESSDIDVAICSSPLFDQIWVDIFDYWRRGGFWEGLEQFRKYLFRGWMRPDKLPPEKSFERSREWWDFFRCLASSGNFGPYKISGALYKSWHFLESYQAKCVGECKQMEETTQ
jgi:hypothetical protein